MDAANADRRQERQRNIALSKQAAPGQFHLYGTVRTGTLGDEFIVLTLFQKPAHSACSEIKVPRGQILAIIEHPCDEGGLTPSAAGFCAQNPTAKSP